MSKRIATLGFSFCGVDPLPCLDLIGSLHFTISTGHSLTATPLTAVFLRVSSRRGLYPLVRQVPHFRGLANGCGRVLPDGGIQVNTLFPKETLLSETIVALRNYIKGAASTLQARRE